MVNVGTYFLLLSGFLFLNCYQEITKVLLGHYQDTAISCTSELSDTFVSSRFKLCKPVDKQIKCELKRKILNTNIDFDSIIILLRNRCETRIK